MRYELRTMSVGEILDMSIRLMRDNFLLLCAITGLVYFPYNLFTNLLSGSMKNPEGASAFSPYFAVLALIGFLVVMGMGPVANGAVTKAVADRYLDQPTSFGRAYGYVFRRIGKLVGALLLVMLFVSLGFLLLIVPGILLGIRYLLVPIVVVVEDVGGATALKRSRELMKGNWGKAVVLGILLMIVWAVMAGVSALIPQRFLAAMVSAAVAVLYTTFGQVSIVVIYMHARCQKEAFDLEFLAKSLAESQPTGETG